MKRFASDRVAGLMERMGLEGDVAIESRLVSKTIENAQSRVEGYNFDIRKRVVEYDDVINKQRETIYAERDKVLRNEDLSRDRARLRRMTRSEILVEQHLGPVVDDWDLDGLARSRRDAGHRGRGPRRRRPRRAGQPRGDRGGPRSTRPTRRSSAREQQYGAEIWAMVERLVLLRSIDTLWVDHLTELDDFRRGVGLRGYGGTDPLVEFKREAFKLYEELRGFIRHQVASHDLPGQRAAPGTAADRSRCRMPSPEQLAALRASGNGGNGDGAATTAAAGAGIASRSAAPVAARSCCCDRCGLRSPAARVSGASAVRARYASSTATRRSTSAGAGGRSGGRSQARSQRPVLVRLGAQVQEVPRPLRRPPGSRRARGRRRLGRTRAHPQKSTDVPRHEHDERAARRARR